MESNKDRIELLENRMRILLRRQNTLKDDLLELQTAIDLLKNESKITTTTPSIQVEAALINTKEESISKPIVSDQKQVIHPVNEPEIKIPQVKKIKSKSSLEKFVGENLISKIGIIILVIGVGIGAKYAIEHDLISPLTRIVLGYFVGAGLLAAAIGLKKNYENFSAVILSGSVAIFYIITFLAYSLYGLIPQGAAFVLMIVFTLFTVVAAIHYNKQVIALYGLVGAYAIPFLLSSGSGRFDIFFTYITIVNVGILGVSILRYWKLLFYCAFGFTWLIFAAWLFKSYEIQYFSYGMIFSTIFYLLFYATFIVYKIYKSEKFNVSDIIIIILNTFIYFFIGYGLLSEHPAGENYLGAFAVFLAFINFIISYIFYKKKSADKKLFFFTIGLVFVFITIAIPVQFDGYVVTNLWAGVALVLFWLGRSNKIQTYELISYPIFILAFFSLTNDWNSFYAKSNHEALAPIFNISFLSNLLFIIALGIVSYLMMKNKNNSTEIEYPLIQTIAQYIIPGMLLFVVFNIGRLELFNYFDIQYKQSLIVVNEAEGAWEYNSNIVDFRTVWFSIYVLSLAILMSLFNKKWLKIKVFGYFNMVFLSLAIVFFLTAGLYGISELRFNYLNASENSYYAIGISNIAIRYFAILFALFGIIVLRKNVLADFKTEITVVIIDIALHTFSLWILSSELIHILDLSLSNGAYKLSLSILWGLYALFLVAIGIWKQKAFLRITGIVLFGITLVKLFFYDIAHLNTISKTIVFLALGVLLLIISFLYNKFKHKISIDE